MFIAAIIILSILAILAIFQLALVMGAPIGQFAWGGQHKVLPTRLRVGSAVSIVIYAFFAVLVLRKSGIALITGSGVFLDVSLWVVTVYLIAGIPLNALSRSKPERYTMTPTVLVLAILMMRITLS